MQAARPSFFITLRHDSNQSTRVLDGVDKMTAFTDESIDKMPVVDGNPAEAGMNQYSSFGDPMGAENRIYDNNSALKDDSAFKLFHDYSDRIVEIKDQALLEVVGVVSRMLCGIAFGCVRCLNHLVKLMP